MPVWPGAAGGGLAAPACSWQAPASWGCGRKRKDRSASMAPPSTATDFLRAIGTNSVPHGSRFLDLKHGSFFDHLVGTYEVLERWGAPTSVCLAGMYHSVYGTEGFQGFTLPISERSTVADVIGSRAEFAAFINCVMDRDSLDSLALAHVHDGKGCEQRLVLKSLMGSAPSTLTMFDMTTTWMQVERATLRSTQMQG